MVSRPVSFARLLWRHRPSTTAHSIICQQLTDIARKQALLESLTVAPVSFVAIDPSEDVPVSFGSGHRLSANGAACLNQTWPAATLYSNRFFTLSLFQHQALAPYDYVMRIDSGSF